MGNKSATNSGEVGSWLNLQQEPFVDGFVEQGGSLHVEPERRSVAVVGPLEVSDEELQDQVGIGVVKPEH